MTFGNLLTVIFFGYLFYYAGMISYDQFFKKEAIPLEATVDEEEIDISDEAGEFHPVNVVEELIPKVNELAEKGKDCPFGKLLAEWNEIPQAA